jgi:hypothetical protein
MAETDNKYLTRCHYYGRLKDIDYISEALVLNFIAYTATNYYGNSSPIRIYVPSDMEDRLVQELIVGDYYYIIAAPYRVQFNKEYRHRVDLLLNIFKEII